MRRTAIGSVSHLNCGCLIRTVFPELRKNRLQTLSLKDEMKLAARVGDRSIVVNKIIALVIVFGFKNIKLRRCY